MGLCYGKPPPGSPPPSTSSKDKEPEKNPNFEEAPPIPKTPKQSKFPFYSPSPLWISHKSSPANSSLNSTPLRIFKRPFPPPSPAKHLKALLARRHGSVKPNGASIPEGSEPELGLDKSFGFSKNFFSKYELGEEVGRGHFGYTSSALVKKGELKGQEVAVKVIPKSKVDPINPNLCFIFFHLPRIFKKHFSGNNPLVDKSWIFLCTRFEETYTLFWKLNRRSPKP